MHEIKLDKLYHYKTKTRLCDISAFTRAIVGPFDTSLDVYVVYEETYNYHNGDTATMIEVESVEKFLNRFELDDRA